MPSGAVLAIAALAAIGYVFVGKPVARAGKSVGHATCHVLTLGHKCKAPPPAPPAPVLDK